jgi:hypothetical protein
MTIQEYVIRFQDGLWEVRLGNELLCIQPTQIDALRTSQALAQTAALCGEQSKIVVSGLDGRPGRASGH